MQVLLISMNAGGLACPLGGKYIGESTRATMVVACLSDSDQSLTAGDQALVTGGQGLVAGGQTLVVRSVAYYRTLCLGQNIIFVSQTSI